MQTLPPAHVPAAAGQPGHRSTVRRRVVRIDNGPRLPALDSGATDGVPVLMLHGLPDSALAYGPVLDSLPPDIRAVVPTQRGFGDADRPFGGYGPRNLAADAVAFLDAVEVEAAVVVGHSLGAQVAQCLAALHTDRVRAVVLIGGFPPLQGHALVEEADALFLDLVDPVEEGFVQDFQASTVTRPIAPDFFRTLVEEGLKVPARVWKAAWLGMRDLDLTQEYPSIEAPVRLVWGTEDAFSDRAMQQALLTAIPTADLEVYEGAGHSPHWEDPKRFATDLATWIREWESTRG